jgi:segregation and condensation protein A
VDVEGAIVLVRSILALKASFIMRELLPQSWEKWQMLSMLLALLELARMGELHIRQTQPFAEVEVERDRAGEAA